ncbi:MAG: DUF3999 family protein, partial [Acidobacteriota bacterium]
RRTDGLSLQIRRDRSGAIIDMTTDPEVEKTDKTTAAYLLDASSFERVLNEIQLEWEPTEEGFAGRVSVESSDDLDRWVPRAGNVTIADLRYGEHRLIQQKIPLNGFKAKYLRLSWPKPLQGIKLTAVTVRYVEEQLDHPWLWLSVGVTPDPDKPGEYRFDTEGRLPVSGM